MRVGIQHSSRKYNLEQVVVKPSELREEKAYYDHWKCFLNLSEKKGCAQVCITNFNLNALLHRWCLLKEILNDSKL